MTFKVHFKVHFLQSHLNSFPEKMEKVSDEHCARFDRNLKSLEEAHQCICDTNMCNFFWIYFGKSC